MLFIFRKKKGKQLVLIGMKCVYGIPSHYYECNGKYYMKNKGVGFVEINKADVMTVMN